MIHLLFRSLPSSIRVGCTNIWEESSNKFSLYAGKNWQGKAQRGTLSSPIKYKIQGNERNMSNFLTELLTICLKFVMLLQLSAVFTQGLFFRHYFMATIVKVFVWVLENVCWHLSDSDIDNFLTNVGKVNFVHKIKTICTFLGNHWIFNKNKGHFLTIVGKRKIQQQWEVIYYVETSSLVCSETRQEDW